MFYVIGPRSYRVECVESRSSLIQYKKLTPTLGQILTLGKLFDFHMIFHIKYESCRHCGFSLKS